MLLFGAERSVVLWLLLAGALSLTIWETRDQSFSRRTTAWWFLLVTLIHVLGYIALRVVAAVRDRDSAVST